MPWSFGVLAVINVAGGHIRAPGFMAAALPRWPGAVGGCLARPGRLLIPLGIVLSILLLATSAADSNRARSDRVTSMLWQPMNRFRTGERLRPELRDVTLDLSQIDFTGPEVVDVKVNAVHHRAPAPEGRRGRAGQGQRRQLDIFGNTRRASHGAAHHHQHDDDGPGGGSLTLTSPSTPETWSVTMKAHRVDLASLIFGCLFLVGASWWLLAGPLGLAWPRWAGRSRCTD